MFFYFYFLLSFHIFAVFCDRCTVDVWDRVLRNMEDNCCVIQVGRCEPADADKIDQDHDFTEKLTLTLHPAIAFFMCECLVNEHKPAGGFNTFLF